MNIPEQYADYWYLRDLDLQPELFKDYPSSMGTSQCEHFLKEGWLFRTEREAVAARAVMVAAYRITSKMLSSHS